jgi:hypothetical protein
LICRNTEMIRNTTRAILPRMQAGPRH